ncbi:DUF3054 domain-containing protein [Gephyromycinifex aptenodytis]|uniref:DUF3054 domain-containing protein n=1 Tax=Gephyromycinifex aptenodytis TaxID=2716227 RepID=UPI001445790A|nr:DUF3054 domain-containing protein [Gephyromycinifex aptenodytis]
MTDRITGRISAPVAALVDALGVLVFAAIGRRSHAESGGLVGVLTTAWPFLAGAGLGWVIVWLWRRHAPTDLAGGVVVWLATVAGGMLLRALSGAGTAVSFILVTTAVTALILLGWRAVARAILARRSAAPHA